MASSEQLKALLKSHLEGDEPHFFAVAMQVAAHEAKQGHGKLAGELGKPLFVVRLEGLIIRWLAGI